MGGTDSIDVSDFGFNIPSMNIVTRVCVMIRYANSSTTSGKLNYVKVSGPNMSVPLTRAVAIKTDPDHLVDHCF